MAGDPNRALKVRRLASGEWAARVRRRGCTHAKLDTFDFQARGFYERLGYEIYGELLDFPLGHAQFHLRKRLAFVP